MNLKWYIRKFRPNEERICNLSKMKVHIKEELALLEMNNIFLKGC